MDQIAVYIAAFECASVNVLYVIQIMPNFYLFRHRRVSKRSLRQSYHHEIDLRHEKQVDFIVIV